MDHRIQLDYSNYILNHEWIHFFINYEIVELLNYLSTTSLDGVASHLDAGDHWSGARGYTCEKSFGWRLLQ